MRPRSAFPILLAIVALVPGTPAVAQEDGVFVDPDSPSGQQYAIPLESARRQTDSSRDKAKVRHGARTAPLFGEGVGADDDPPAATGAAGGSGGSGSDSGGSGGSGSGSSDGSSSDASPPAGASAPASGDAVREAAERADEAPGGGTSLLLVGLIAAGVCGAAAATGLALRRRDESGPSPA